MSEQSDGETPPGANGTASGMVKGAAAAVVLLAAFQVWWGMRIGDQADRLEAAVARLEQARDGSDDEKDEAAFQMLELKLQHANDRLDGLQVVADEWEFIVQDIQRLRGDLANLINFLEQGGGGDIDNQFEQPVELDWTEPGLRAAAQRAAETVGITLTEDEVRVPARLVLHEGLLEYFAVLKGGKEHEAMLSLQGNTPADERRPSDFGVKLNNAVQALGFKRGKPLRITRTGVTKPEGETAYLFVEWTEGDERVVVRAEDLVWNRLEGAPMERGKWVYVGSSFVPGDDGQPLFAADLTAEAVASYSAINAIFDNTSDGAADDTVFLVATPRLPEGIEVVDFVIRREDKEPTRTFTVGMPEEGDAPGEEEGE